LHIFPTAVNLINEQGDVLSLLKRHEDLGPFSVLLGDQAEYGSQDIPFERWIQIDSRIVTSTGGLKVGDTSIVLDKAKMWNPKVPWDSLTNAIIMDSINVMNETLVSGPTSESLVTAFIEGPRNAAEYETVNAWQDLGEAILIRDLDLIETHSRRVAGLGGGLTPAGDDFLIGTIYALWSSGAGSPSPLIDTIVSAAIPYTTSLSIAWLKAASRREAGLLWHEFVEAISSGKERYVADATSKIAAVGHTSGGDALAGFMATVEMLDSQLDR
jgi:hypothetical protein